MSAWTLEARENEGCAPLTPEYTRALEYAANHHRQQCRKGSKIPYLSHLMSVSALVLEGFGDEKTAIAALLHDAVEDATDDKPGPVVLAEIRELFGDKVARIVEACSDGLDEKGNRSGSWAERKLPYVSNLGHKDTDAMLVTAADKTHNARAIAADVRTYGLAFFATFNACPHQLAWYYASVRDGAAKVLGNHPLSELLTRAVDDLLSLMDFDTTSANDGLPDCGCPPQTPRSEK